MAVAAPGKEEVEAAEGMRAVLGALRRRLEGGCQAVQDAEQLAARKAALLRTSLQLLHTHCSRTFQASHSTPIQPAASTLAASDQRSGKGELRPAHGSSQPAAAADGVTKAPVLVCEELSATLEGGRCAVRAQLRDRSGRLDLRRGQLLVSCADGPVRASMPPAQDAPQQSPSSQQAWQLETQRDSRSSAALLWSNVDLQGLVPESSRAPLGVIAVVPLWDSTSAGRSAHSGASNSGSGLVAIPAQNGYHMQHVGSLRLEWPEMLRSQAQSSSAGLVETPVASEPEGKNTALSGSSCDPKNAATGSKRPVTSQRRPADARQSDAWQSEGDQHQQGRQLASAACGPQMAGEQRSAVRLCLEADKGSVGDVPKLLETALGLRLEWLTSTFLSL